MSNQVLVSKDARTGEIRGVTVELGKALAQRLGVPFEAVQYPNPVALVKSFNDDDWDIAFLAYDPARAQEVTFSPPYMEVDNSYLILAKSALCGEGARSACVGGALHHNPPRNRNS
jgi:polar amino acid transport system substrate-binding protein